MKRVRIRVTGITVGVALVFPYDHDLDPDEKPLYRVPTYQVQVNGASFFSAIRFGFRGHFEHPWDTHRKCDEGINVQREVAAKWNAIYSPHSFEEGKGLPGGFLIRQDMVYIHEGPSLKGAGGTLSCIEITRQNDGEDWNRFLETVRREAGVSYVGAAMKHRNVLVTVGAAASPDGLLVGRAFRPPGQRSFASNLLPNWQDTTEPWGGR